MKKAKCAADVMWFEEIPNVGPRIANDFKKLGLSSPKELKGKSALKLYQKLCVLTRARQDPCVLDVFMSAVDFMKNKGTVYLGDGHATTGPKQWSATTSASACSFN